MGSESAVCRTESHGVDRSIHDSTISQHTPHAPAVPLLLAVEVIRSFNFDNPLLLITSCVCVVPRITLPGINLSDSAYGPFPTVDNYFFPRRRLQTVGYRERFMPAGGILRPQ